MQNTETNRIENKEQLNEDFEQEVIAFLNYKEGGIIYVGINKNGQVVGVEDIDLTQLQIKDRIKNKLHKSKSIKKLDAFKEYEMNYDYVPKNLKNYFDGEVSILIVDKNYRGKRIGEKLLLDVFELAKNDGMGNLKIETDESCNYKFYESLGCQKKYETIIGNNENDKLENPYSEKAFIYEKKL